MKPLLTFAVFASLAGIGSAATIVQTKNFAFVPNGNQAMTFDKFDTSLGTLESVTVTVTMNKTGGRFEIDNDSETAGTVNLTHEVQGSLSTSLGSTALLNSNDSFIGASGTLTASNSLSTEVGATTGDSTTTFNATGLADYVLFEPGNSSDSDTGTVSSDFQFKYEGTGTYTMTVNASQLVSATGLGGLQQAFTVSSVSGDVTVTYNYTPTVIPEPVSPLLGGLGMLLLFRRRR